MLRGRGKRREVASQQGGLKRLEPMDTPNDSVGYSESVTGETPTDSFTSGDAYEK